MSHYASRSVAICIRPPTPTVVLASYDFITAVASLHHMDEATAVRRMAELLGPELVLGIVGLARSRTPADFACDLAGAFTSRAHKLANTYLETPAPRIWPPAHT